MARQLNDGSWQYTPEEHAYMQHKRQTADFAESVYNDPSTNKDLKALIKKKYPSLPIPDYDLEQQMDKRFAERDKKEEDAAEARRKEADDRHFKEERERTQKQYGLTDDAMERMEKMMIEKNVGDYDVAASYFAAREPKSSEAAWDSTRWHHEKAKGFEEIAKDPEAWGRNEIMRAINQDEHKKRYG